MTNDTNTDTTKTTDRTTNTNNEYNVRELRLEKHPTGWAKLTQDTELVLILDAVLDSPTGEQFNRNVISRQSGVDGETLKEKMDVLEDIGVIRYCDDEENGWYEIIPVQSNPVVKILSNLNGIMNKHYSSNEIEMCREETTENDKE